MSTVDVYSTLDATAASSLDSAFLSSKFGNVVGRLSENCGQKVLGNVMRRNVAVGCHISAASARGEVGVGGTVETTDGRTVWELRRRLRGEWSVLVVIVGSVSSMKSK